MICYAAQSNLTKPAEGNSGAIPSCVTTSTGFFIGDAMMRDKEDLKAYCKAYYLKNKKKINARDKVWQKANTKKQKAHKKAYYLKNKIRNSGKNLEELLILE